MIALTCRNHPGARYLTKEEPGRLLHWVAADPNYVREIASATRPLSGTGKPWAEVSDEILSLFIGKEFECPCPASDLIEIGRD